MLADNTRSQRTLCVGIVVFLLLSVVDFLLTRHLVSAAHSEVGEINPVASWVLEHLGWGGLAAYKLALVAAIGATVLAIAWRKQAVGNCVIMFGCGAQASIVVTGLMLLQSSYAAEHDAILEIPLNAMGDNADPFLPPGAFALLVQESVQRELGLSADLINDIAAISRHRVELRRKIRADNLTEGHDLFFALYGQERLLAAALSQRQAKRLQQLCWQVWGDLAILQPAVYDALQLTDEQMLAIGAVCDDDDLANVTVINSRAGGAPTFRATTDLTNAKARLVAVLDTTQKTKWQAMQGDRFVFEAKSVQTISTSTLPIAE